MSSRREVQEVGYYRVCGGYICTTIVFRGEFREKRKKYEERSLYSHISLNSFEFESLNHVFRRYSYCNAPARIVLNQKQRPAYRRPSQIPSFTHPTICVSTNSNTVWRGGKKAQRTFSMSSEDPDNPKTLMLTAQRPRALPIPERGPKVVLESRRS